MKSAAVEKDATRHNFAGRKVAVIDPLADVVGVYRLTEVGDIVRRDFGIGACFGAVLCRRVYQLPWRGCEADVCRLRIAGQDLRPFVPCRAMALIDDDVAEGVLWIVGREEGGVGLVGVK